MEKSDLHTLIAFNRNEAVITEVIEIILDIMAELELSPAELLDKVILFKRDYMTVRNILYDFPGSRTMDFGPRPYTNGKFIRHVAFRRQKDEPIHQLRFVEPVIGLFHLQMCILGTIYKAHWGSEEGREPAFISRFVKLLGKPGILSPKVKDFRSYAQLFDQILDSYIIPIAAEKVKAVSEHDFHQPLGDTNWPRLIEAIVEDIFPADHGIARVHRMRYGSDWVEVPLVEHDLPFEKFLLLCQQGLVYRDYSAAISTGDTGRLKHILSIWTTQLHGTANTNYPRELIHLMGCLTKIWTPEMRDIWMRNCLVNPPGEKGKWMPDDLFGEYVVREIKLKVNPSTNIRSDRHLREIVGSQVMSLFACKKAMVRECKSQHYGTRSTALSTSFDVLYHTRTLLEEGVGRFTPNRAHDENGAEYLSVSDLLSDGARKLATGVPLNMYKERARYHWISGSGLEDDEDSEDREVDPLGEGSSLDDIL